MAASPHLQWFWSPPKIKSLNVSIVSHHFMWSNPITSWQIDGETMETETLFCDFLKEINPQYSLEGLMPKLKLQYFGHKMWRADSLEKILMLEKIEGRRRRGWQRTRWLDCITYSMNMSLRKLPEMVKDRDACWAAIHFVA